MEQTTEPFECFEIILKEALNSEFDQLLVVARADASHLYMLYRGRVKKGITFEKDITRAFVEYFTEQKLPDPVRRALDCELNVTASIGVGKCFSVKITKKEPID